MADLIYTYEKYPMLLTEEFRRAELSKLLTKLGMTISKDGLGWKYGPMGFQQSHQSIRQEITPIKQEG